MNKVLQYLFYIAVGLLFLPAFAFPLAGRAFRVYFIFLLLFFGLYIFLNFKTFIKNLLFLYKKTPYKYLIFFIVYLFILAVITAFKNFSQGISSFLYTLQFVFLYVAPTFLLSALFLKKYMSVEKFLRFYFIALFLVFTFGLIEFIGGKLLGLSFINTIQNFLANERQIGDAEINVYYLDRLQSVFAEPSWLGIFVFLNFPVMYKCAASKYKIFKNKYLNAFMKKSIVPLAWSNIIFSLSPIWLIFCSLQAMFIFRKKILKLIFNIKTLICIVVSTVVLSLTTFVILLVSGIKIEPEQLVRIINTLSTILDFQTFLLVEQSLGSRIVSYTALFCTFLEHPIFGVGLNNAQYYVGDIITKYSIPLSLENLKSYNGYLRSGRMTINSSYLYALLAETGIIGTALYFVFLGKTIQFAKKVNSCLKNTLMYDFTNGLIISTCCYCFLSIYGTTLTIPYNWFFLGIIIAVFLTYISTNSVGVGVNEVNEVNEVSENGRIEE